MKRTNAILAALVFGFALVMTSQAQVFSTNWTTGYFNSGDGYGPAGDSSLDGAPTNAPTAEQWQTTDPYNDLTDTGATSLINWTQYWTYGEPAAGNQSVFFGNYFPSYESPVSGNFGILPNIADPVLYRDFTLSGAADIVRWTADFGLINLNDPAFPYDDVFGFNLMSGTNSLAKFAFNPATATLQDLRFEWSLNGLVQTNNPAQPLPFEINYGSLYRITATLQGSSFDLTMSGLVAQTNGSGYVTNYSVFSTQNLITGGSLSGAFTALDFSTAAVTWDLVSGDATMPGADYMILNTMSVENTIIPEPGTWAASCALLGIAGLMLWRRKATTEGASL